MSLTARLLAMLVALGSGCGGSSSPSKPDGGEPVRDAGHPELPGCPELRSEIEANLAAEGVPGWGFALVRDGELRCVETGGVRCIEDSRPSVTDQTLFRTAFLNRLLTTITALESRAAGVVSFEDPVVESLPDLGVTPAAWAEELTLHHLLTQTSGLPTGMRMGPPLVYTPGTTIPCGPEDQTLADLVGQLDGQMMGAPPGRLSQGGVYEYPVVARVLEAREGKDFPDIVRERILDPVGLHSMHFVPASIPDGEYACPHFLDDGIARGVSTVHDCPAVMADALGYMNIRDAARLVRVLLNDGVDETGTRVLAQSTIEDLYSVSEPTWISADHRRPYALYRWDTTRGAVHLLYSQGWGNSMAIVLVPEQKLGLVAFHNTERHPYESVVAPMLASELEVEVPALWYPDPQWDHAGWEELEGTFTTVTGDSVELYFHERSLMAKPQITAFLGIADFELVPRLRDRYQAIFAERRPWEGKMRVWRDSTGAVEALTIRGFDLPFWRAPPEVP